MKKKVLLILALVLLLVLAGCANAEPNNNTPANSTPTNNQVDEKLAATGPEDAEGENAETDADVTPKVLVAYFSATNNTAGIAAEIAESLGADLYAITPAEPYTAEDLNYGNDDSRTSREMNDPDSRPALGGDSVENMADYDVVFLGYPIWWGQAPRIISSFLEAYDFSGKTIVPFCTSGSSGIGSSASNLHSLAADANWLEGRRFAGGAPQTEVANWATGLNLTTAD